MYNNHVYPLKTLEEMQRDAVEKHGEEADRLCKGCFLFIGWLSIFIFICNIIIMTFIRLSSDEGNKEDEKLVIIEEYFIGSMSESN